MATEEYGPRAAGALFHLGTAAFVAVSCSAIGLFLFGVYKYVYLSALAYVPPIAPYARLSLFGVVASAVGVFLGRWLARKQRVKESGRLDALKRHAERLELELNTRVAALENQVLPDPLYELVKERTASALAKMTPEAQREFLQTHTASGPYTPLPDRQFWLDAEATLSRLKGEVMAAANVYADGEVIWSAWPDTHAGGTEATRDLFIAEAARLGRAIQGCDLKRKFAPSKDADPADDWLNVVASMMNRAPDFTGSGSRYGRTYDTEWISRAVESSKNTCALLASMAG